MFAAINSFLTGALAKVTDVYWPFVSMLLHGDGTNAAQNNTFLDGSTNNFTVTRNGNTTQGSFNPFVSTYPYSVATNGGSAYFDGTGDYLSVAALTSVAFGSNDFTVECWANTGQNAYQLLYDSRPSATAGAYVALYVYGGLNFVLNVNGSAQITSSTISLNTWYHVAISRVSGTTRMFVNGVSAGSFADSTVYLNGLGAPTIGANGLGSQPFFGYISNLRVVNGTGLYTTTFTPPTAPLTAVTNTALLLGMSNGAIYDNAELNNLETVGTAQISTSVYKYGTGSMKFNGAGDALVTVNKTALKMGGAGAPFTMECWIYPTATPTGGAGYLLNDWLTGAASGPSNYILYVDGTNLNFYGVNSGNSYYDQGGILITSSSAYSNNVWTHVAVCYDGTTCRLFKNGVVVASTAWGGLSAAAGSYSTNVFIGTSNYSTSYGYIGYIDDIRITKGIARYTTTFTPPTAAFPNLGPTYPSGTATQRAIFAYGYNSNTSAYVTVTNLVSNTGVVAGNTTGVGTSRVQAAGANYGGDKAIIGYGTSSVSNVSLSNLVSNTGAVSTDTTGVGTARYGLAASGYGTTGQAIFGFGNSGARTAITNLVSNTGVVATDTTGVGTARMDLAAAKYSTDKAIFAFGSSGSGAVSLNNLVSNTGVVATDTTSTATARQYQPGGASYGVGLAIFGYGMDSSFGLLNSTNLVSNTGVVASDTTGVGTARNYIAASSYGGDKAIFAYGNDATNSVATSNLVSNTGVVATDTTGVGTVRYGPAAAGFSYS